MKISRCEAASTSARADAGPSAPSASVQTAAANAGPLSCNRILPARAPPAEGPLPGGEHVLVAGPAQAISVGAHDPIRQVGALVGPHQRRAHPGAAGQQAGGGDQQQ